MKGKVCEESHLDSLIAILWFRLSVAVVFFGQFITLPRCMPKA